MRLAYDAAGQLTMARNAYARVQLIYNVVGYISSEILHTQYGQHSTLNHTGFRGGSTPERIEP